MAVLLMALAGSTPAVADGCFFSRTLPRLAAASADQRAIIVRKGSLTSMILSTAYTGNGEDFAWIIPTPAPATIREAGREAEAAFELFDTITAVTTYTDGIRGALGTSPRQALAPRVTIHESVTLEHFEASVLSASGAAPLLDWLSQNGYRVDPAAASTLDAYIRESWSFVAVKLRPSATRTNPGGYLPPILITYRSDRLVFPVRISAVSSTRTVLVRIYVVAESTVTATHGGKALDHTWSGRYEDRLFEEARGLTGGRAVYPLPWFAWTIGELTGIAFDAGVYLTRVETRLAPSEMVSDIVFTPDRES